MTTHDIVDHQHNMREWADRGGVQLEEQQIPKIVCSEALL